jgi:hypothetical protein
MGNTGRVEDIPDNIRPGRRSELYQAEFMKDLLAFLESHEPHTYWSVAVESIQELESVPNGRQALRRLKQHVQNVLNESNGPDLVAIERPYVGSPGTLFVADEKLAVKHGKTRRRKDRGRSRE